MKVLTNLMYTKDHEWLKIENDKAYVGITDYAQHTLGDIVFIELPKTESTLEIGDVLGVIESVKAASDIYSPISGAILEVNEELIDNPELINEDPYKNWIAVLSISDSTDLSELLNHEQYTSLCNRG